MTVPSEYLKQITEQVRECVRCNLHISRKNSVPGEGPDNAEVMLIGEGPGFNENEQGRPFVGQAGKFLEELLGNCGYKRTQVYITNVVKCRPPGNRDPLPEELAACGEYLEKQISIINPMVIITLGRFSMARFFPNVRISEVHGKPRWIDDRLIIPMYHPAAALHQPALRSTLVEDFHQLPQWLEKARQKNSSQVSPPPVVEIPQPAEDAPTQLSLF